MLKKYINLVSICLFASLCANEVESQAELSLDVESQDVLSSMEHLTKGHKCKKNKCFCRLRVNRNLFAKNIDVNNEVKAKKISAKSLTADNISAVSVTTDTINDSYLVSDSYESVYMLRGSLALPDDFDVKVTLTPASSSQYYPYGISVSFVLNGNTVDSLPVSITLGKGFSVGNLSPRSPAGIDLAGYGVYPYSDLNIAGVAHQDADSMSFFFKIPVTFNQPFSEIPVIIFECNLNIEKFIFGSGSYGTPGGTSVTWFHNRPMNVTKSGFDAFFLIKIDLAGTQSLANLSVIEQNIANILKHDLPATSFIVAGNL